MRLLVEVAGIHNGPLANLRGEQPLKNLPSLLLNICTKSMGSFGKD